MSPLVELITAWDKFAATNANNSITVEDFCIHYLSHHHTSKRKEEQASFSLARRLGRIAAIQRTCLRLALREVPGIEPEWYYFLHSINELKEVKKTEIISINLLLEPTTGINILNRMIEAGLLEEKEAAYDRRARLIRLTPKGETTLKKAEQQARIATNLLFSPNLAFHWSTLDDHLSYIEYRFRPLLTNHRPKNFDDLLQLHNS